MWVVFYSPNDHPGLSLWYTDAKGLLRRLCGGVAMVVSKDAVEALVGALVALVALVEKVVELMHRLVSPPA
jgi:hypothetical protein